MKVKIVQEVKRSDGLWRFACGNVFSETLVILSWVMIYYFSVKMCTALDLTRLWSMCQSKILNCYKSQNSKFIISSCKVAHSSRDRFAQFCPLLNLSFWQVNNNIMPLIVILIIITFISVIITTIVLKSFDDSFSVGRCLFLGRTLEPFNSSLIHWGRIAGWNDQYGDNEDDEIINTMKMMMMILSLPGEWREWRVHGDTVSISVSSMLLFSSLLINDA